MNDSICVLIFYNIKLIQIKTGHVRIQKTRIKHGIKIKKTYINQTL